MNPMYIADSVAMLKYVMAGQTYQEVGQMYGLGQTAVQQRIRLVASHLQSTVGVLGVADTAIPNVQLLRTHRDAYLEALEHYKPEHDYRACVKHTPVSDDQVALLAQAVRTSSHDALRDVALLMILFSTAAKPLEIARLAVADYLQADGTVREQSVIRPDVAINGKERPLYFASAPVNRAIDQYLRERVARNHGTSAHASFRGLVPWSKLFLRSNGESLRIREKVSPVGRQYHCKDILVIYRRIFKLAPSSGITAMSARRTIAHKLAARGVGSDGIGQLLGLSERATVQRLVVEVQGQTKLSAAARNLINIDQHS